MFVILSPNPRGEGTAGSGVVALVQCKRLVYPSSSGREVARDQGEKWMDLDLVSRRGMEVREKERDSMIAK